MRVRLVTRVLGLGQAGRPRSGDETVLCPAQLPGAPHALATNGLIEINSLVSWRSRSAERPGRRMRGWVCGSSWMPGSSVTRNSMSAGSNAWPRLLAWCTHAKNPRDRGSFSCAMPRCGHSQLHNSDQPPSMVLTWPLNAMFEALGKLSGRHV